MRYPSIFPIFIVVLVQMLLPNRTTAQSELLSAYVQEGLTNDLNLKQQQFQLARTLLALDETKTAFRPTVNFNTTYSTAAGGRQIAFPVGSLLNPVYTTLNKLTDMQSFPQVADYRENFYPRNFYDLRLHAMMPLINAELKLYKSLQAEQVNARTAEQRIYKRELTETIKTAYLNYLKATEVVVVQRQGILLMAEVERLNKSLVQNGKANPTGLLRVQNELAGMRLRADEAATDQQRAELYLKHLLNRITDEPIRFDSTFRNTRPSPPASADGNREELASLRTLLATQRYQLNLSQVANKPKLGLSVDVGSQGQVSSLFGKDQNVLTPNGFFLAGISFDLPVYSAGRRRLRVAQQQAEINATELRLTQAGRELALQTQQALLTFQGALTRYDQQKEQQPSTERYYRDLLKQYREGVVGYVELIDAQQQLVRQQTEQTLRLYDAWISRVHLERAIAAETIN